MSKFRSLITSNLPETPVSHVVISGLYPEIAHKLKDLGINTVFAPENPDLPYSLCCHADMQLLQTAPGEFFVPENLFDYYCAQLSVLFEVNIKKTPHLGNSYPDDAVLNILLLNGYAIGLKKNISRLDLSLYKPLYVKQGYTRCSTAAISKNAVITSDEGIYKSALKTGLDCLLIKKGSIVLEGFKEGFFGGCCGMLGPDRIVFTGSLNNHEFGNEITKFCDKYGKKIIELSDGPLVDIGGIIPVACY